MFRRRLHQSLVLFVVGSMGYWLAAEPAIGVATTRDNAATAKTVTLFNGSAVETKANASDLNLNTGTRLQLASNSRVRVFKDRLLLEQGSGVIGGSPQYAVEASTLRVSPLSSDARAQVTLDSSRKVIVSGLSGVVQVAAPNGLLLAYLSPGRALSFDPQEAGASAPSTVTGCLRKSGDKFYLTVVPTGVTYEIDGGNLTAKDAGNTVEVTGTAAPGQIINASSVKRVTKGCVAGAGPAGTSAAAAGAGGGHGTAIIGGIIVAGAVAGVATAVVLTHDEGNPPPLSPTLP